MLIAVTAIELEKWCVVHRKYSYRKIVNNNIVCLIPVHKNLVLIVRSNAGVFA